MVHMGAGWCIIGSLDQLSFELEKNHLYNDILLGLAATFGGLKL